MLTVAKIFHDHMVLQRNKAILIWGTASPHASVRVTMDVQAHESCADAEGKWRAVLPAMEAGSRHAQGLYLDGDLFDTLELLDEKGHGVAADEAVLDGDSLILRGCGSAVTIRYAQTPFFTAKLFNAAGIPAKPFEASV